MASSAELADESRSITRKSARSIWSIDQPWRLCESFASLISIWFHGNSTLWSTGCVCSMHYSRNARLLFQRPLRVAPFILSSAARGIFGIRRIHRRNAQSAADDSHFFFGLTCWFWCWSWVTELMNFRSSWFVGLAVEIESFSPEFINNFVIKKIVDGGSVAATWAVRKWNRSRLQVAINRPG